jgi:hypothetical protein
MSLSQEQYEVLLMKAVDGVLTPEEQVLWDEHLRTCESSREEFMDFVAIKETTDSVRQRILLDAELEPIREGAARQAVNWLGFSMIVLGGLLLAVMVGYEFFSSPEIPMWHKVGSGLLWGGFVALFAQLFVRRVRTVSRDPYRDIDM